MFGHIRPCTKCAKICTARKFLCSQYRYWIQNPFLRKTRSRHSSIKRACIIILKITEKEYNLLSFMSTINVKQTAFFKEKRKGKMNYLGLMAHETLIRLNSPAYELRIDNGGLEYMCTWFCVFSYILAIHQSIWTYYISNKS